MEEERKDIGDLSVLKRVLKVEHDSEQTLQNRRRIYEEKIAQTRLDVDTRLQEVHRKIVADETNLQAKTDQLKKQIEKEFDEATSLNICKIEDTAAQNRDLAIDHILSLLENVDNDGKSIKGEVNGEVNGEGAI